MPFMCTNFRSNGVSNEAAPTLMPAWAPLVVLLAGSAILRWQRRSWAWIYALLTAVAVFLALVVPITYATGFALLAWIGVIACEVVRYLVARPRAVERPGYLGLLMAELSELHIAHHHKWISDEDFHRAYDATMNRFEEEECDVLVRIEPVSADDIEVHLFVHRRQR